MAKKILGWRPNKWMVAVGAMLFLMVLLVPLYRIAEYSIPWYDDYMYGRFAKGFLEEKRTLWSASQGAWYCTKTEWYCFQGTFSSDMFMAMIPIIWGDQYYALGVYFLLTILLVSSFALGIVLLRDVLKADWASSLAVTAITVAMVFEFMHTINGGFYWYIGGVHYVAMHSFLMLLIIGWIKLLRWSGKTISAIGWMVWTVIGAVLVGGSNFVTTLQGLLLGLSFLVLGIFLKKKNTLLLLPSLVVNIVCFGFNIGAPGNANREALMTGMTPVQAVIESFVCAFQYLLTFTGLITIVVMVLLVPIIWHMVKKLEFGFHLPGLVLAWSFCLYATGFTPSLYGMSTPGLGRTLNAVKITFQILLIMNEVYWLGYLQKKLSEKGKLSDIEKKGAAVWWFYPIVGALMLVIFTLEPNQSAKYSTFATYYYVHTGEAYNLHDAYLQRIDTIKNSGDEVVVEPYFYKPWVLLPHDMDEDSSFEANVAMAQWYGKKSISCVHQEQ